MAIVANTGNPYEPTDPPLYTHNRDAPIKGQGVRTVTTTGTDVRLSETSIPAAWVLITAQEDNTSKISVGVAGVDATIATGTGTPLDPGDSVQLTCNDLRDVYIDSLVSGEGVRYTYGA